MVLPGATIPDRGVLPDFLSRKVWVDFRTHGLADPDAFRRLVAGINGQPPGRDRQETGPSEASPCPYKGLAVFDEEDARYFLGRESETQHLLEKLDKQRFLAVVGPSGSDKSSVVRAGLLPQLRKGALPSSQNWKYSVFKPGPHPFTELANHVAEIRQQHYNLADFSQSLEKNEQELHLQIQQHLQDQSEDTRVCLVIDQFEEVFTLCQSLTERTQFTNSLRYAATVAGGRTVVILTLRADFVTRAAEYKSLAELISGRQFLIGPMDQNDLHQAIERPAQ